MNSKGRASKKLFMSSLAGIKKYNKSRKSIKTSYPIHVAGNDKAVATTSAPPQWMTDTEVKLKLLVDIKANKVLFAEAGKEFVDFLIHIFSLPIGRAVQLLTTKGMLGSLGYLSNSIQALSSDYLQPNVTKDAVLQPSFNTTTVNLPFSLLKDAPKSRETNTFFKCSSQNYADCETYVTDGTGAVCPRCKATMSIQVTYVEPNCSTNTSSTSSCKGSGGGYVKGVMTYMVMDNLEVKPMSIISGITLVKKFDVKDMASLVEKEVQFGLTEGVALLKASLQTENVLTTLFL